MSFELPELPYERDALEPHVSARTLEYHHGKHHKAYVDKLNAAIEGSDYAHMSLEDIIAKSEQAGDSGVFNNAAQAWNHDFLWKSMSPDGGGAPQGALMEAIEASFGGLDAFKKQFKDAAMGQFGSGWAWLVSDSGKLAITSTPNAKTPLTGSATPLLTLDVWEHAYYLDFQNRRDSYIDSFLDHLANWNFAASNL
ncbi:MAG: superoxide dismutase [Xanthomonadales bacterium]|nr:superoxide dismutase [Xanthomonadales bacterium]